MRRLPLILALTLAAGAAQAQAMGRIGPPGSSTAASAVTATEPEARS